MKLVFTLPGEWTSPGLMLRLLEVVESDWQATERGFASLSTGRVVSLAMAGPISGLDRVFADGFDPTRPPLDDALLQEIAGHKAVVQVSLSVDAEDPVAALDVALAATNAIIDGGALAVHVGTSGLVHGADAFQGLLAMVGASASPGERLRALATLVVRYRFGARPMTLGMHALGRPDAEIGAQADPDRAIGALERLVWGPVDAAVPDDRGLHELLTNPYGLLRPR